MLVVKTVKSLIPNTFRTLLKRHLSGRLKLHPAIQQNKNLAIYLVYIIAFSFSLQNYQYTFNNSTSIDMLYRVVGSRLMVDGKSPYYDKWQAGKPDAARFYHPIPRYSQKINGVTVTPAILWMNSAFANENFCRTRNIWFNIQIGALFLCGLIMLISFRNFWQKLIALVAFVAFFVFSRNFYLHLHSAQVYVFYALIFCGLFLLLKSKVDRKYFYIGLLITLSIWLKPFFVVLFLPFLFRKNLEVFKGTLVMGSILLVHTAIFDHWELWKEYLSAMPEYAMDISLAKRADFMQIHEPSFDVPSCIYPMRYPDELPLTASSLRSVQYYLSRLGIDITNTKWFALTALLLTGIFSFITRKRNQSAEQLLATMFLLYFTLELFTPTLRFGYYLVQWAAVSVIILSSYKNNKLSAGLMLIGLVINNGYFPFPDEYEGSVGEALMLLGLLRFVMPVSSINNFREQSNKRPECTSE
jgi:hypothetical protein